MPEEYSPMTAGTLSTPTSLRAAWIAASARPSILDLHFESLAENAVAAVDVGDRKIDATFLVFADRGVGTGERKHRPDHHGALQRGVGFGRAVAAGTALPPARTRPLPTTTPSAAKASLPSRRVSRYRMGVSNSKLVHAVSHSLVHVAVERRTHGELPLIVKPPSTTITCPVR